MAYLIDRQRAFRLSEVVVVRSVHRERAPARRDLSPGRARSQVVFKDNSLLWTLTRPRTLLRCDAEPTAGVKTTVS